MNDTEMGRLRLAAKEFQELTEHRNQIHSHIETFIKSEQNELLITLSADSTFNILGENITSELSFIFNGLASRITGKIGFHNTDNEEDIFCIFFNNFGQGVSTSRDLSDNIGQYGNAQIGETISYLLFKKILESNV